MAKKLHKHKHADKACACSEYRTMFAQATYLTFKCPVHGEVSLSFPEPLMIHPKPDSEPPESPVSRPLTLKTN